MCLTKTYHNTSTAILPHFSPTAVIPGHLSTEITNINVTRLALKPQTHEVLKKPSSGLLLSVALVKTDVSEERSTPTSVWKSANDSYY
jgi:hypothetical protein